MRVILAWCMYIQFVGVHQDSVKGNGSVDHDSGHGTSLKSKEKSITSDVSIYDINKSILFLLHQHKLTE